MSPSHGPAFGQTGTQPPRPPQRAWSPPPPFISFPCPPLNLFHLPPSFEPFPLPEPHPQLESSNLLHPYKNHPTLLVPSSRPTAHLLPAPCALHTAHLPIPPPHPSHSRLWPLGLPLSFLASGPLDLCPALSFLHYPTSQSSQQSPLLLVPVPPVDSTDPSLVKTSEH